MPGGGAACDNLLTKNQRILSEPEWNALLQSWITAGNAIEVTTSQTFGDLKLELEKLCTASKLQCVQAEASITQGVVKP